MRDMFANYDSNSSRPSHFHKPHKQDVKILESLDNISIVRTGLHDELGVQVKNNTSFDLYLYLDGWVEGSSIDALVAASTIRFKVITLRHKVVFEKIFNGSEIFNFSSNYLKIHVTQEEAELLDLDSYKMNIMLEFADGTYELFTENDGLLIVK